MSKTHPNRNTNECHAEELRQLTDGLTPSEIARHVAIITGDYIKPHTISRWLMGRDGGGNRCPGWVVQALKDYPLPNK